MYLWNVDVHSAKPRRPHHGGVEFMLLRRTYRVAQLCALRLHGDRDSCRNETLQFFISKQEIGRESCSAEKDMMHNSFVWAIFHVLFGGLASFMFTLFMSYKCSDTYHSCEKSVGSVSDHRGRTQPRNRDPPRALSHLKAPHAVIFVKVEVKLTKYAFHYCSLCLSICLIRTALDCFAVSVSCHARAITCYGPQGAYAESPSC